MNLHFKLTTFSLYFLSLLIFAATAKLSELRSLLEFKKGIQVDPSGTVHTTWALDAAVTASESDCPKWTGITCDDSGAVTGIGLDYLGLVGDLKFHTLVGLTVLHNLSLAGNSLSGRLAPALGLVTSLQYLDLSGNRFYGPIPGRINDLWGLNYLNLSRNNFTGGFPGGIRNLQQLRVFDLHSNELWGDVGNLLSELKNVEYVDLSSNKFFGGIAVGMENVSSLANTVRHLDLSHNGLTGGFLSSDTLELFKNLKVLDLKDNKITGELPSFGELPSLKVLRVGKNQLYGPVPEELFQSMIPLEELDLSGNGFTGSIPGVNSTTLNTVNMSSNELSGTLPTNIGRCVKLDLSNNMVSGDISIVNSWETTLEILDLSSNNLTGRFSTLSSKFEKLITLKLSNNRLQGSVHSILEIYPSLSTVDLSSNDFSGTITGNLFTSMSLMNLNLSGNHFTGSIAIEGSRAGELLELPSSPALESLDLSRNSFGGLLPSDIGHIGRLRLLNLSNNKLLGQLPSELGKLSGLKYLDLSGNNFDGSIPTNLPSSLITFNVSYNELSGSVPDNLKKFPMTSFRPGNSRLNIPSSLNPVPDQIFNPGKHHSSKRSVIIAIIVASVGVSVMILFVLFAYRRVQQKEFHGRSGFNGDTAGREVKSGRWPSLFGYNASQPPHSSMSFSHDHLLTSKSVSMPGNAESVTEIMERAAPEGKPTSSESTNPNLLDLPAASGRKSSPGSPLSSSPRFIDACEPVMLEVYSPDRLAGELFFLDTSLIFTPEQLSRAPAEVLGRSSHGTLYKATLGSGHLLTVKWLRVGLVKNKKEFAKEVKKIGSMKHPNIVPLRAYYWGPREQERLLLADYVHGDSLTSHLYETTPRRHPLLSFSQRVKVAIEVARCLVYLHERGLPHGDLKPTNILLTGPDYNVRITDYGLHRLMMPTGIAEQILNLGAYGYRAPELANAAKPAPSFKADVYAFGVILMELLTRRSAGDIISGQSGAVDLTDWVKLCDQEGRRRDCIDSNIAGREEPSKGMEDVLAISIRCILPVNERPNIREVLEDLNSVTV